MKTIHELSRKSAAFPDGGADAERFTRRPTKTEMRDYAAHYECDLADVVYSTWREAAPKRGRPQYGAEKRVVVTARVTPETAAKLHQLAEKAGSVGLALDQIVEGKK